MSDSTTASTPTETTVLPFARPGECSHHAERCAHCANLKDSERLALRRVEAITRSVADIPPQHVQTLVPGILYECKTTILAAREGAGKSTLAAGLAVAVASGRGWLTGEPADESGAVVIASEEHPAAVAAAVRRLSDDAGAVYVLPLQGLTKPADLAALVRWRRPRLVVIDPMADALALSDERSYSEGRRAVREWMRAAWPAALLLLHHQHRESDRGRADSVSEYHGSIGPASAVDLLLELRSAPAATGDTRRDLFVAKSRISELPRGRVTCLDFEAGRYRRRPGEPLPDRPPSRRVDAADMARRVAAFRAEHPKVRKTAGAAALGIARGSGAAWRAFSAAWDA